MTHDDLQTLGVALRRAGTRIAIAGRPLEDSDPLRRALCKLVDGIAVAVSMVQERLP